MKHFKKHLAIGLSVATVVAVGICYFMWSLHSIHRLVYFFLVVIGVLSAYRYMSAPDWVVYGENEQGKTDYDKMKMRKMTMSEKFGVMLRTIVGIGIIGALVWTIGYGVACLCGWKPELWELYLLYGIGVIAAIGLVFCICFSICVFCNVFFRNRRHIREKAKSFLLWVVIVVCSLALAGTILYYLIPWIEHFDH